MTSSLCILSPVLITLLGGREGVGCECCCGVVASANSAFQNNVWKVGGACSYPASTHRNIHDSARSVRQYFSMTGSNRVFLGCWVSLDEQDRLCEVSLDRSTTKEVSRPSKQQIDSSFQAYKSYTNPTINKFLTRLLSAISESRYAVKEMHPLILSSYSTTSPPLPSRLMSKDRPKLLNDPRNVLDQGVTRGWWHRARVELRKALQDNDADLVIPRRRSTRSHSPTTLTRILPHLKAPPVQKVFPQPPSLLSPESISYS